MTPELLRSLQMAILADAECAAIAVTPEMGKVEGGAYAADQAVAKLLNAKGFSASSRSVPCHLAKRLLIKRGRWRSIVAASMNPAHPAIEAAYAAVALAEDARMEADFLDASAAPLMDALVATKLLSPEDRTEVEALCLVPSNVTPEQVSRALRGPWGDESPTQE